MKINWKEVAKSKGYQSLKSSYISYINHSYHHNRKAELYPEFRKIINRAIHYAYHQKRSLIEVLDEWEEGRTYCWRNYYHLQGDKFKRINHSNSLRSIGIVGSRKRMKKDRWYNTQQTKNRVCELIQAKQRKESTKEKPRWTTEQRECYKKYGRL